MTYLTLANNFGSSRLFAFVDIVSRIIQRTQQEILRAKRSLSIMDSFISQMIQRCLQEVWGLSCSFNVRDIIISQMLQKPSNEIYGLSR